MDMALDFIMAMASVMLNLATDMGVMAVALQGTQLASPTPTGLPRDLEPDVGSTMVKTAPFLTRSLPLSATAYAKSFNNCCNTNSSSIFTRHEKIYKKINT